MNMTGQSKYDRPVDQEEGQLPQAAHLLVGQGVLHTQPHYNYDRDNQFQPGATTNRPSSVWRSGPGACMILPSWSWINGCWAGEVIMNCSICGPPGPNGGRPPPLCFSLLRLFVTDSSTLLATEVGVLGAGCLGGNPGLSPGPTCCW